MRSMRPQRAEFRRSESRPSITKLQARVGGPARRTAGLHRGFRTIPAARSQPQEPAATGLGGTSARKGRSRGSRRFSRSDPPAARTRATHPGAGEPLADLQRGPASADLRRFRSTCENSGLALEGFRDFLHNLALPTTHGPVPRRCTGKVEIAHVQIPDIAAEQRSPPASHGGAGPTDSRGPKARADRFPRERLPGSGRRRRGPRAARGRDRSRLDGIVTPEQRPGRRVGLLRRFAALDPMVRQCTMGNLFGRQD